ncbi:hypothetical protein [Chryseobacterium sp. SIMBA_038]|uniref:hypothetical protein n=1 Tax=Chryseobacterium sp. SIMBA_038 TaxID=3085780 RepID=UPI00397BE7AB
MKSDKELSIWFRFFSFIYKPKIDKLSKSFIRNSLELLSLFIFGFVLRITISLITPYFVNIPMEGVSGDDETSLYFILVACLLSPLIEEIAFRLPLLFSNINFSFSATIISFFIVNRFFHLDDHFDVQHYFILRVIISCLFGFLVWLIVRKYHIIFENFYNKRLEVIVYSYSLLFAFMHIANYDMESANYLLFSIFIMLPHFISAFILSFVRLNYGFSYALFLHILNNMIPLIIICFII